MQDLVLMKTVGIHPILYMVEDPQIDFELKKIILSSNSKTESEKPL